MHRTNKMRLKKCTCCKEEKKSNCFNRDKSKRDKKQSQCVNCIRKNRKDYINRNRKRIYAYNKTWQSNNLDKYRVYNKKAYQKRKNK